MKVTAYTLFVVQLLALCSASFADSIAADGGSDRLTADALARADVAYEMYRKGKIAEAILFLEPQFESLTFAQSPSGYVRTHSLYGGMLNVSDRLAESDQVFKRLFELDLSSADPTIVAEAKMHYGTALYRFGEVGRSLLVLQETISFGLDHGEDRLALTAGANLSAYLVSQGMFEESSSLISSLRSVMDRNPESLATLSLTLGHANALLVHEKNVETISLITPLLERLRVHGPVLLGQGFEYLATAYIQMSSHDEALRVARAGAEAEGKGSPYLWRLRLLEAQALVGLHRYREAAVILGNLSVDATPDASLLTLLSATELEAMLGMRDFSSANQALLRWKEASRDHQAILYSSQEDYYRKKFAEQESRATLEITQKQRMIDDAENEMADLQRNVVLGAIVVFTLLSVIFLLDRSRRRLKRVQLEKALMERRHMEAVGLLTGNMAHDFNNMLQVVMGSNELIEVETSDNNGDDRIRTILRNSNKSLLAARNLIGQLLAYSREQSLRTNDIALVEYLESVESLLKTAAGEVNELRTQYPKDEIYIAVDGSQLVSALLNLIKNAVDAMASPGIIELSVATYDIKENDRWCLNGLIPGSYAEIRVTDTGSGMTAAQLEKAMEPFFTTKASGSGTGLGLSSISGFVRQSRGDIRLESELGVGTTVKMLFPLAIPVQDRDDADHTTPSVVAIRGAGVLLVEDNNEVGRITVELLEDMGARVEWVKSAEQALIAFNAGDDYQYVLSDINLPGIMNGIELRSWIAKNHPAVETFLMSGVRSVNDSNLGYVLPKPFNRRALQQLFARAKPD